MGISEEEVAIRRRKNLEAGFDEVFMRGLSKYGRTYLPKRSISDTADYLLVKGFCKPVKLIEVLPPILGLSFDNIDAKIEGLKKRGFDNPIKLIATMPAIFCYTFSNIDAKIEGLKKRGFVDPIKLITSIPAIFGYSFENIDTKIEGLKKRGFAEPVKILTSLPTIFCYRFDNIDAKIEGLKKRGFADPIKLITSMPGIFCLGFDNIDWRMRYFMRICKRFMINISVQELMLSHASLWTSKREKLQIIMRLAYDMRCKKVTDVLQSVMCNLENLLLLYISTQKERSELGVIQRQAKKLKDTHGSIKNRRQKIVEQQKCLQRQVYVLYCKAYIQ